MRRTARAAHAARWRWCLSQVACCVVSFGVLLQVASDFSLPWHFAPRVTVPCLVGSAAAALALLVPYPRTAVADLARRAAFHSRAVSALLDTQHLLVMSNDADCLAHAEARPLASSREGSSDETTRRRRV